MKNKSWSFIGFTSTTESGILYDIDLVKRDLWNVFSTPYGSCDWDPTFGSKIDTILFESQTASTKIELEAEVTRILSSDTRLKINSVYVEDEPYKYNVICKAQYLNIDPVVFSLQFNKRNI